ncbi:hypothetical protein [Micromonospora sp. KC213]|uniref:hypothetical protein n=1 Tax=Micromonospora sp. KC213 TaxID=2530378 RepID=UPI00104804B7|nr:hypothetical protein [Micromonospora sp. KC213]TDC44078.1 hypothetical protein E1166_00820 [Micromonospora sp. KC213]
MELAACGIVPGIVITTRGRALGYAVMVGRGRAAVRGVVVMVAVGAAVGCSASSGHRSEPPLSSASAQPSASASSMRARLELPMRLGSRSRFDDRTLTGVAIRNYSVLDRLVDDRRHERAVASVYNGETDADYAVLVSAAAGTVRDEEAALNTIFGLYPSVGEVRAVDAGPLGGVAACGDGRDGQYHVTMCAWVDRISAGIVAFVSPKKRLVDRGKELVGIRSEVEFPIPGLPADQ